MRKGQMEYLAIVPASQLNQKHTESCEIYSSWSLHSFHSTKILYLIHWVLFLNRFQGLYHTEQNKNTIPRLNGTCCSNVCR